MRIIPTPVYVFFLNDRESGSGKPNARSSAITDRPMHISLPVCAGWMLAIARLGYRDALLASAATAIRAGLADRNHLNDDPSQTQPNEPPVPLLPACRHSPHDPAALGP